MLGRQGQCSQQQEGGNSISGQLIVTRNQEMINLFSKQAEFHHQQLHDADKEEEHHSLLGEEGPRVGQAMRLG